MDKATIYTALQGAIERSGKAVSWSDVSLAIMRAKERKTREQLDSLISGWGLAELHDAEGVAWEELNKTPKTWPEPPTPPIVARIAQAVTSPPSSKSATRKRK